MKLFISREVKTYFSTLKQPILNLFPNDNSENIIVLCKNLSTNSIVLLVIELIITRLFDYIGFSKMK